jgi:hypothetical protein
MLDIAVLVKTKLAAPTFFPEPIFPARYEYQPAGKSSERLAGIAFQPTPLQTAKHQKAIKFINHTSVNLYRQADNSSILRDIEQL